MTFSRDNEAVAPSHRNVRIATWCVVLSVLAAGFFLLRAGLFEVFTDWNRWQFAIRPELENWTLPGRGVEGPATVWAIALTSVIAAAAGTLYLVRRRRR